MIIGECGLNNDDNPTGISSQHGQFAFQGVLTNEELN